MLSIARQGRRHAGAGLLLVWGAWLVAAFAAIGPRPPATGAAPDAAALAGLRAHFPDASQGQPLAVRLTAACTCTGDELGWQLLAGAVAGHRGLSAQIHSDDPALAGYEVLILGGDGGLRYAGPLRPEPTLCGGGAGSGRLARWLPALLASSHPLRLEAMPACAC